MDPNGSELRDPTRLSGASWSHSRSPWDKLGKIHPMRVQHLDADVAIKVVRSEESGDGVLPEHEQWMLCVLDTQIQRRQQCGSILCHRDSDVRNVRSSLCVRQAGNPACSMCDRIVRHRSCMVVS